MLCQLKMKGSVGSFIADNKGAFESLCEETKDPTERQINILDTN
jgi:hypothetical protein